MDYLRALDIAQVLQKNVKWIYANADKLGGVKVSGSWIFSKKGLDDALQRRQPMESGDQDPRETSSETLRPEKRRRCLGILREEKIEREAAKRHKLDRFLG